MASGWPAAAARASIPKPTPARTAPVWPAVAARDFIPKSTRTRTAPESHAATAAAAGAPRCRRNEDMLWEILLRLPPQPSSLRRASAVCRRWRGLVTDPRFLRRFRAHHRKPPLLGFFESFKKIAFRVQGQDDRRIAFRSILEPPDRIPLHGVETSIHLETQLLGCCHGRILLMDHAQKEVIVCSPITGDHHRLHTPPGFTRSLHVNVAVLCAAADQGHVHGSCHSDPFKVVVMSPCGEDDRPVARVYSSETGLWGNPISAMACCELGAANPGVLVGDVLYWSSKSASAVPGISLMNLIGLTDDIIEFDLDRRSLAVIKGPPDLDGSFVHQIIQAEDGAVGLAIFSHGRIKMWERKFNSHGGATWLLQKTVEMHTILGLPPQFERSMTGMEILGYDEDNSVIFLCVDTNVYMVQLMSMQSRKLYENRSTIFICGHSPYAIRWHPFTGFYAPAGGCVGAGPLPLV